MLKGSGSIRKSSYQSPLLGLTYDEQRLIWRSSQPEWLIRSLASDYLRGLIDECNSDAYLEYQKRWGRHNGKSIITVRKTIKGAKRTRSLR